MSSILSLTDLDTYTFPKRLNMVFDLDHTVLCTLSEEQYARFQQVIRNTSYNIDDIIYRIPDNDGSIFALGVKRPYLNIFLKFCSRFFNIYVWSAGDPLYVKKIVQWVFPEDCRPIGILTRIDCGVASDTSYYKPLSKMYSRYPTMNPSNTIILDDRKETMRDNLKNGILMPPYTIEPTIESIEREDTTFLDLMIYFLTDEVLNCEDVRYLNIPEL